MTEDGNLFRGYMWALAFGLTAYFLIGCIVLTTYLAAT